MLWALVMLLIAAFWAWRVYAALCSGETSLRFVTVRRQGTPVLYWFCVSWHAVLGGVALFCSVVVLLRPELLPWGTGAE